MPPSMAGDECVLRQGPPPWTRAVENATVREGSLADPVRFGDDIEAVLSEAVQRHK